MGMTFRFRLLLADGSRVDPPEFRTTELVWKQGDQIPLGRRRVQG
jgi:hypothetical protein